MNIKKDKKSGEEILKENFKTDVELKTQTPSILRILLSFVLFIPFLYIVYFIFTEKIPPLMKNEETEMIQIFYYKLVMMVSGILGLYFFFDFLLLLFLKKSSDLNYSNHIPNLILSKKTFRTKIVLSMLIFSIFLRIFEFFSAEDTKEEVEAEAIGGAEAADKTVKKISKIAFIMLHFSNLLLSVSLFFMILIVKYILMTIIKYKMHFAHYRARIDENRRKTELLHELNKITDRRMYSDMKEWASFVFSFLSQGTPNISFSTFSYYFGEEMGKEIFDMFDTNNDGSITEQEFISVYYGVIYEKYSINKALSQKSTLLKKLSIILNIIIIPVALFTMISILSGVTNAKSIITMFSGTLLSLSFVFSQVIGEVFRSLIFIFFVKAYEAGDVLKIDDTIYIVEELGLLYSTYRIDYNIP